MLNLTSSAHGNSAISVVDMAGATIAIQDASATDTILSVKQRVFAVNDKLPVRRQRLVYGPHGIDPLANDETLGRAGVAQDGSAKLDMLLVDLNPEEMKTLCQKVYIVLSCGHMWKTDWCFAAISMLNIY